MANHPNRSQIRVPVRLIEELAGALDLALSRLEWAGLDQGGKTAIQAQQHGRELVEEARGRVRIIGAANRGGS